MISKIKNKEDAEKKRRRNQLLLGAGLVILLLFSTAGFAFLGGHDGGGNQGTHGGGALAGETLTEKGIEFSLNEPYWVTNLNGQQAIFQHLPTEVEDIDVRGLHGLHQYSGSVIYFVGGTDQEAAEIINNLHPYVLRYQRACHESVEECEDDLPTKTCSDRVFIFTDSEAEESVYKQENCVYLTGDPIRAADAFLYKLYEIN